MGLLALSVSAQSDSQLDSTNLQLIEEEIGQMIMVGIRGTHLNDAAMMQTQSQISNGEIGGIIFFKHNIKNSRQFRIFVKGLKALPLDQPLFLAVDEEGGLVRRLKKSQGFEEFPAAAHVGANLSASEAYDVYSKMAKQIHDSGLNLNLGPVVDVNINRLSPAIGQLNRSFSRDPDDVFKFGEIFIRAHNEAGVLATLKHYPGHGSSREDTHNDVTDITNTWRNSEQLPFKRLIDSNVVDMIMAGHLFNRHVDPNYPASMSHEHIQKILRDELGYNGVVITDDLQMGAIIKRYALDEIVISAINSGCDILQFSDPMNLDENLPLRIRDIIITGILDGKIDADRIHESYGRITNLKQKLNKVQKNND